jgi:hypothetical protein
LSSLGALATNVAWCASLGRQTAGLLPCSSPSVQMGVLRSLALPRPPTRPSRELQSKQKDNRGRIPSLGPAGPTAPVTVSARHQKAAYALTPAEQNVWQIDPFGDFLTFSAPPCLDGAKTDQSPRFELSRCLGNQCGLVCLVRTPNCRFTSVFESQRPNGRVALSRSAPASHQAKSRTTVETKGQPWQDPVAGSRGANRSRNCQCAPPEGGLRLETS